MSYSFAEKLGLLAYHYTDKIKSRALKLSDPKAWNPSLWNLYGMGQTASGVVVNEETATNLSSVYAAIKIISGDISTLPIHLYKKLPNNTRKVITNHESLQRLTYRSNPLMPAINFREATMAHVLSWGNMYAEITRNKMGQVAELWPLTPDRVMPEMSNGALSYRVKVDGKEIRLPADKVMHIAGLGFNGLMGYSVLQKAAESIGLSIASEQFGARYFGSNTNLGGAIKYPRALGPDARKNLKNSLAGYTGSSQSHRWMILEQGMEIEKIGFSPDDSQFLQTRQFQVSEIARWFNCPPHKLKDLTRSTFSNIEEQEIEYVVSCLVPWLTKIEQGYNINLLTEKETKLGYYFKHSVKGLLRGSAAARADYYTKRFYLGSLSPNDIRALEDEDPIDNDNADKYYIQMNLMPLDDVDKEIAPAVPQNIPGEQPPAPEEESEQKTLSWSKKKVRSIEYRSIIARDKIVRRYYPLISEAAGSVVWRERLMIHKILKNKNSARDSSTIKAKISDAYSGFGSYIEKKMSPVFMAMSESVYNQSLFEIGESVETMPQEAVDEVNRYISIYAVRHSASSQGQLLKVVDDNPDDIKNALETRISEWEEKRPEKIASNESVRLSSFAAQTAFFAHGYKTYWRIRGAETCAYCHSLNGRSIKQGQNFFKGGEEIEPKGAKNGPMFVRGIVTHPPLHQGCDCYISAR